MRASCIHKFNKIVKFDPSSSTSILVILFVLISVQKIEKL